MATVRGDRPAYLWSAWVTLGTTLPLHDAGSRLAPADLGRLRPYDGVEGVGLHLDADPYPDRLILVPNVVPRTGSARLPKFPELTTLIKLEPERRDWYRRARRHLHRDVGAELIDALEAWFLTGGQRATSSWTRHADGSCSTRDVRDRTREGGVPRRISTRIHVTPAWRPTRW